MSQTTDPTLKMNPADAGRQLRLKMLTTAPGEIGLQPTAEFPRIYGVLIDWPVGELTATIVSLSDGNASLYTTSTFGIIGGIGHESVRNAAKKLVLVANRFFEDGIPAADYPYPAPDRVKFYLLTFEGVKMIAADFASIRTMKDKYSSLFGAGQDVVTQLRLLTEKKKASS